MYSTVDRLFSRYPRLKSTNAASATMADWLTSASNYIDGYIGSVVTLPLVPVPGAIVDLCEDVANAMYLRRNVVEAGKDRSIERQWSDIEQRLRDIQRGKFILFTSSGTSMSMNQQSRTPWSNTQEYTPTFGVSDIEDAQVDPDRIDDEEALR